DQLVDDVSLDVAATLNESELADLFDLGRHGSQQWQASTPSAPDPSTLDAPALADLVISRLRSGGWEPISIRPIASGVRIVFARHGDEDSESLVSHCRPAKVPMGIAETREAIEVIRAASTEESRALIVCLAGLEPEAAT